MAIPWKFLMAKQILENSFITSLARCDVHKWSTNNACSLDDIFPVVIGLNSPGSNTQSVTLSFTRLHRIFSITPGSDTQSITLSYCVALPF